MGAPGSESTDSLRLPTSHSGRTNTPSEYNFPMSLNRPRNRPRNRGSQGDDLSIAEELHTADGGVYVLGPNMQPLHRYETPRLRTDQRVGMRYSVWNAPSLDHDLNTTLFGRQNRQVLLFCVGFIFPLGKSSVRYQTLRINLCTNASLSMGDCIIPPPTNRPELHGRAEPDRPRAAVRPRHRSRRGQGSPESELVAKSQPNHVCDRDLTDRRYCTCGACLEGDHITDFI
jgi:hypothetical protein